MKEFKKTFCYTFFCIEIGMFVFFYVFGMHGIQVLRHITQENNAIQCEIQDIKREIQQLEGECYAWECSSFCKEKIARERLQMARRDDIIYYLD